MDVDGFWDLVERSAEETRDKGERVKWLKEHLSGLSAEEIVDYHTWFTIHRNRACTWDMYAVCYYVAGFGSSDGFEYFVDWLISLGREAFEKVVDCPDRIVELPEVQRLIELARAFVHRRISTSGDVWLGRFTQTRLHTLLEEEYPQYELFAYVTFDPYQQVTGEDTEHLGDAVRARGVDSKFPFVTYYVECDGEPWDWSDREEFTRRLPRLASHYEFIEDLDERSRRYATWWPERTFWRERIRAWVFHREGTTITWRDISRLRYVPG